MPKTGLIAVSAPSPREGSSRQSARWSGLRAHDRVDHSREEPLLQQVDDGSDVEMALGGKGREEKSSVTAEAPRRAGCCPSLFVPTSYTSEDGPGSRMRGSLSRRASRMANATTTTTGSSSISLDGNGGGRRSFKESGDESSDSEAATTASPKAGKGEGRRDSQSFGSFGMRGIRVHGSMGEELLRVMSKRNDRRQVSRWEDNCCLPTKRLARAFYGPVLGVMERPVPKNPKLKLLMSAILPSISLLVLFLQLNFLSGYSLPSFSARGVHFEYHVFDHAMNLDLNTSINIAITSSLLGLLVLIVVFLAVLFYYGDPTELLMSILAGYISLVCGPLYIPIMRHLLLDLVEAFNLREHHGTMAYVWGILTLVAMLVFVPFSLVLTQNKFVSDANTSDLFRRKHNRLEIVLILVKTLAIFVSQYPLAMLALYLLLLLSHAATMVYYRNKVNRALQGMYLGLVFGAVYRVHLSLTTGLDVSQPLKAYWIALPCVMLVGAALSIPGLGMARFQVNSVLARSLSFLDLELDPRLIHDLHLASYLHSASRLGRYADFLSQKWKASRRKRPMSSKVLTNQGSTDDKSVKLAVQASDFFTRALALDPNHAVNLSRFAAHRITLGEYTEARQLLEKALVVDPTNKETLETYAAFLNHEEDPSALTYFQRAVMQYLDHYRFRHLYANSTSAILITSRTGTILDCNGAALQLCDARQRSDLCNNSRKVFDVIEDGMVSRFRKVFKELDGLTSHVQTSIVGCSKWHGEGVRSSVAVESIPVDVIITKVTSRSKELIHIELVDMRKMNELMEAHRLIFENVLTSMVMVNPRGAIIRCNRHAEQAFGYKKGSLIGATVQQLFNTSLEGLLLRHRTSSFAPFGRLSISDGLTLGQSNSTVGGAEEPAGQDPSGAVEVEAKTKKGSIRNCLVQISNFTVRNQLSYILSIQDITVLKREKDANKLLFERSMTAMIMTNRHGVVLRYNDGSERTFGYSREEVVGQSLAMLLPESQELDAVVGGSDSKVGEIMSLLESALENETEVELMAQDGGLRTCVLRARRIQQQLSSNEDPRANQRGIDGGLTECILITLEDMTALKEAMDTHRLIFDQALEPLVMTDEQGVIEFFNQTAVEAFGFSKEEAIGQVVSFLFPPERECDAQLFYSPSKTLEMDNTARRKQARRHEVGVRTQSGKLKLCSLKLSEIVLGPRRYTIAMFHDNTVLPDLNSTVRKLYEAQGEQDEQEVVKMSRASIVIPMPIRDSLLDDHLLPQAFLPRESPDQQNEVQPFHSSSDQWTAPSTASSPASPASPSITNTIGNGYTSTYNSYRQDDSIERPPQATGQKLAMDGSERRITPPPRLGSSSLNTSSRSLAGIFGSPNNRTLTGIVNNRSMTSLDSDSRLESGVPSPRNSPMPCSPRRLKLERDV